MVRKVVFLATAMQDLQAIHQYIAYDSTKFARLEVKKIKAYTNSLIEHPFKGRLYQISREKEIRTVSFRNYMIFYTVSDTQIIVMSIHHHSRSLDNNPALNIGD